MTPNLQTLPDSISYLLLALGVIAIVVYIKATIDDVKAARRERAIRGFRIAVGKNRTSPALAEHYMAAAYGDPDDFNYWEETAKLFKEDTCWISRSNDRGDV